MSAQIFFPNCTQLRETSALISSILGLEDIFLPVQGIFSLTIFSLNEILSPFFRPSFSEEERISFEV
jgi:hypothetical protein